MLTWSLCLFVTQCTHQTIWKEEKKRGGKYTKTSIDIHTLQFIHVYLSFLQYIEWKKEFSKGRAIFELLIHQITTDTSIILYLSFMCGFWNRIKNSSAVQSKIITWKENIIWTEQLDLTQKVTWYLLTFYAAALTVF